MFNYCPNCASTHVKFEWGQRFSCGDCGFEYFQNVAASTGCIINTGAGILFEVREKEPGKGKLTLPGGFVNPNEGAIEAVRRECAEEIGWDPKEVEFLVSFPNVYPYKKVVYNTCDLYFTVSAPKLTLSCLTVDLKETSEIRFIKINEINFDDIAFDACKKALRYFIENN